jgi:hypothetical protein
LAALVVVCLAALVRPARADDGTLQRQVDDLRREIELQRKLLSTLADLQDMKQRLAALEQRMAALESGRSTRESRAEPRTGTIRLQNRLAMPATIIIDGIPYRLEPLQTRDLPGQPAGTFTFEALVDGFGSLQPRATRTLLPNQVYTIYTYLP